MLSQGHLAWQPSPELACCCFFGVWGGSWPWQPWVEWRGSRLLHLGANFCWLDRTHSECCIAVSWRGVICARDGAECGLQGHLPRAFGCRGAVWRLLNAQFLSLIQSRAKPSVQTWFFSALHCLFPPDAALEETLLVPVFSGDLGGEIRVVKKLCSKW